MPDGTPRSDEERGQRHEDIYGAESQPPAQRQGLGAYRFSYIGLIESFAIGIIVGFLLSHY
ncbi:MAG: hypothetical protein V1835_04020 [Candidatus Micrarchaeota archaeon]